MLIGPGQSKSTKCENHAPGAHGKSSTRLPRGGHVETERVSPEKMNLNDARNPAHSPPRSLSGIVHEQLDFPIHVGLAVELMVLDS